MSSECFSKMEIDAIGEILNISLGASATAVSTMLSTRVDITTPIVKVVKKEEFKMDRVEPAVCVEITYVEGLEGKNIMLLKRHDVKVIVEMMMGMEMSDEDFQMDEITISAVCEVMNQMMGSSATALSEFLNKVVNISTPISFEVKDEQEFIDKYFVDEYPKVVVGFTLRIADKLESEFFNVMPIELAKGLIRGFLPEDQIIDAETVLNSKAKDPVEEASSGGKQLSQEEIEKMLAGGSTAPASEPAPAPTPSEGKQLSQEEIEKMLAGGSTAPASEPVPAPTTSGGGTLSQEEIEKMLAGGGAVATPQENMQPQSSVPAPQPMAQGAQPVMQAPMMGVDMSAMQMQMQMMQQMMQQMQAMQQMQQEQQAKQQEEKKAPPEPKMIHVHSPAQQHLKQDNGIVLEAEQEENMELIMSVPLEVSVEIGRTRKLVKDILDFTKGSLVVLDKLAGEQVDLFVNGQCIAKGDVVVVEDNFGIRITEIMKVNLNIQE